MTNGSVEATDGICIICTDSTKGTDSAPGVDQWRRVKTHILIPQRRWMQKLGFLGAPMCVANSDYLPIEYALLMVRQIPTAKRKFPNIRDIFLIGHRCGYYTEVPPKSNFTIAEQQQDIILGVGILEKHFGSKTLLGLKISGFFAEEDNDGFRRIA